MDFGRDHSDLGVKRKMANIRRQYRVSSEYENIISVSVGRPSTPQVPARCINLCVGGMRVLLESDSNFRLATGEVAYLCLTSPYLDSAITMPGLVRGKEEHEEGISYGFEFIDWLGLVAKLPPELKTLFNQRGEYRTEVGPGNLILIEGITTPSRVKGELQDISPNGLSFRAPIDTEEVLAPFYKVRVSFLVPGNPAQLTFNATIRYCEQIDGHSLNGIFFDAKRTTNFQKMQEVISEYMAREFIAGVKHKAQELPTA